MAQSGLRCLSGTAVFDFRARENGLAIELAGEIGGMTSVNS